MRGVSYSTVCPSFSSARPSTCMPTKVPLPRRTSSGVAVRKRMRKARHSYDHDSVRYTETGMPKAVCLLSGGLDSATCLLLARRDGFSCYALSFDYGQRHRIELEAARRVAAAAGVERHLVMKLGL